jgi:predicted ATPase/class 3 adenylate cyclase
MPDYARWCQTADFLDDCTDLAMPDLPPGTVTFLFTDIEGSARLWEQHPQAMQTALARHDALLSTVVALHSGVVVKSRGEGDSLFAVFARATDASAAALTAQRALADEPWPLPVPLRVRMAVYTGEAELRQGDYYGPAVNRCARLRAIAHGGQVLVSRTTYDLVRDALPDNATLRDLGEHRLRDLARPEQVFQLAAPDLPSDFPPLRSLDVRPHNLPIQPTALIGRAREVAEITRLLRGEARLVTLTGPGGTGKTRLALQVAAELLDDFPDGVWFVNLAPISDPSLVVSTIAQTLGVRETDGRPLIESLKDFLRPKSVLLTLDNFEQVVEAAPVVSDLLGAASGLRMLVTSRIGLRLRAEQRYPVPPLSLPDSSRPLGRRRLTQSPAMTLFVQRAQAVQPTFALTDDNAPAVAEICRRLDGLPLAIELAAARVALLTPQAMLSRLDSRLTMLTGGPRDLPARQQTLRDAIVWSYDLLSSAEQTLFRRLAVFVGGCTFDAVHAVCRADDESGNEVLDGLASLVDASMLRQETTADGEPRFAMLETIREFGLERLEAFSETQRISDQHASYFLHLAEAARPHLQAATRGPWLQRLQREYANVRAALTWTQQRREHAEAFVCIATALERFWHQRGYLSEGRAWLQHALDADDQVSDAARARVRTSIAQIAWLQGDFAAARRYSEVALTIWRRLGDTAGTAEATGRLGVTLVMLGDSDAARPLVEESVALHRRVGDPAPLAFSLNMLALTALMQGDTAAAQAASEEGLSLYRATGDRWGSAFPLRQLGRLAARRGDLERARALLEEALTYWRESGDRFEIANTLQNLGRFACQAGEYGRATAAFRECLELLREVGITPAITSLLAWLGYVAAMCAQPDRAATLLGSAEAQREAHAFVRTQPPPPQGLEDLLASIQGALGDEAYTAAWEAGRALSLEQAIALALEETKAGNR